MGYNVLREKKDFPEPRWWHYVIWDLKFPLNIIPFLWLALADRVPVGIFYKGKFTKVWEVAPYAIMQIKIYIICVYNALTCIEYGMRSIC